MRDFAGSSTTYYSLAREKLRGKHPRIFNLLLILVLISMTGLAAFLLSDILSFGLNSDHKSVLVGLEHQDLILSIMSIINWDEKNINPADLDNPMAPKGGLIGLTASNSSQNMSDIGRLAANISDEKNGSLFQMDGSSQKAKEWNPSNSSPKPNSFSRNQTSSDSTVRNTASDTGSNKLVKEKGTTALIKKNHGSSRETPISPSSKQKDMQQNLNYANNTNGNSTQANSTQAKSTQINKTQANNTLVNTAQLSNIQANNTSIDQLQVKEASTIKSTIDGTSMSQSKKNPSLPKNSRIIPSPINGAKADSPQASKSLNKPQSSEVSTIEDPAIKGPAKEETRNGNGLSEDENKKTSWENSPAKPGAAPATGAQNSGDKKALPRNTADSRTDPPKDASARNTLKIEFKTDSTSLKSENNPSGDHTNSGTVSGTNAPSNTKGSESGPAEDMKNAAPSSGDSTLISKSHATGKASESAQKNKQTVASKTQKAQEIRYEKIANKNRLAENAKKKAAQARARER